MQNNPKKVSRIIFCVLRALQQVKNHSMVMFVLQEWTDCSLFVTSWPLLWLGLKSTFWWQVFAIKKWTNGKGLGASSPIPYWQFDSGAIIVNSLLTVWSWLLVHRLGLDQHRFNFFGHNLLIWPPIYMIQLALESLLDDWCAGSGFIPKFLLWFWKLLLLQLILLL